MGIFSKKPSAGKIHATRAGRVLDEAQREIDRGRDEVARKREQNRKQGK